MGVCLEEVFSVGNRFVLVKDVDFNLGVVLCCYDFDVLIGGVVFEGVFN